MGYRAFKREDLIEEVVPLLDGRELLLLRPRDTEELLDEAVFEDRDEFIPYWADLWPSAILLARTLAGRSLRGARVLELGCGLGLPSLAAAQAGGRVLATDWAPDALEAVELNAAHNEVAVETLVSDWRAPGELLARGPFDLVIAADVLYERRNVTPLTELIERLDTVVWLADPGRPPAAEMTGNLELAGWDVSTLAATDSPRVTVRRLEPGRMS
ncbi:MAG: class I SAM-dependent methyltransferase [Solirubrobacteraceae bacterium]